MTEQTRRATRLVEIERRLRKYPAGLTVRQISDALGYSTRTIQRDLNVLESELGVPLMEATGRRWRLMPGTAPVGAVRLTLQEARAVYLATRLYARHAEREPDGLSALEKLADALPPAMGREVDLSVATLRKRRANTTYTDVLRTLTIAWAESGTVRIRYRSQGTGPEKETLIDPYLLEPSANGAATYLFGFSHAHGQLRTFKVERISSAEPTGEHFTPAELEELRERVAKSWGGAVLGEDEFDVVLEFGPDVAARVAETDWHSSQRLTELEGGRLRFEARLDSLLEFVPWARSWGHSVEVMAPPELREEIAASARQAAALYEDEEIGRRK